MSANEMFLTNSFGSDKFFLELQKVVLCRCRTKFSWKLTYKAVLKYFWTPSLTLEFLLMYGRKYYINIFHL